ncbi:LysR family transcriptional regulator [Neptunicella sp. SCSIO 80796]|uniref:LysR family transcriptional regulator n=1 Tax=Neptunicella plasticusilytica TaxID=3117012 RepID=UPI003A4DBF58
MDRLDDMQHFVRVAEMASFTKAADSLGMPKASISISVQRLETQMGARLLHRTTRKVSLTQDGVTFYERCKDLLADMDELSTLFLQTEANLSGRIRVDMPVAIAKNIVCPALADFIASHPDIEVQLSSTDRRVDMIQEGFDCVVRVGNLTDSELIARPLGTLRIINCVSPAYIQQYGEPTHIEQLSEHRLVHYVQNIGSKSAGWEYHDGKSYRCIDMPGAVTVNNSEAYTAACLAGLGIIQVPAVGVKNLLSLGQLLEVLTNYTAESMPVSLLYPNRRNLSKRVQVFMDWLTLLIKDYAQG